MKEKINKSDLTVSYLLGQVAALSKERAELLSEIHVINIEKKLVDSKLSDMETRLEAMTREKNDLERKDKLKKINNKNERSSQSEKNSQ